MLPNKVDKIVLRRAGEALKLPFFLEEILEEIQRRIGCEASSILMLDDSGKELLFKVTTGAKSSEIKKLRVSISEGVAGLVFRNRKPSIVNYAKNERQFSRRFDKHTNFNTKSILAAPLKLGEDVIGVIELVNKKKGKFDLKDLDVLTSYTTLVSAVIENVELYKYLRTLVEKVRGLENYKEVLLESLSDGVMSTDSSGKIVSINKTIELLLNRSSNDIVGTNVSDYFEEKDDVASMAKDCLLGRRVKDKFCYLENKKDGRSPVAVDASAFQYDKEKGIVFVIKGLKSALNQEEIKRETILRSNLVANFSHEINTPLTSIQAGIQILNKKFGENGQKKYIDIINDNVTVLKERVQVFVDYLKAEKDEWSWKPEEIRVDTVLEEIVSKLKLRFPSHKFELTLSGKAIKIYADERQIERALGLILNNAIQYSAEKTRVMVRTVNNTKSVELFIEDEGMGISEKDTKHLFSKFKRFRDPLKETIGGLGIGLWLAKYLLEKNKATIEIESKIGIGTTARMKFMKMEG